MAPKLPFFVEFLALDKLTRDAGKIAGSLAKVGKTATDVGRRMTIGLTLPIVAAGVAGLKIAGDFETGMNKVRALSGATGRDFERLQLQARELGASTAFSAKDAADGMAFLAQAGLDVAEIGGAIGPTLNLAAAAGTELGETASLLTGIMAGFRLEVGQLEAATDIVTGTFTESKTSLEEYAEAFKLAGPVARGLNQDFRETSAVLGVLAQGGYVASLGGTAFKGALIDLANQTPKTQKVLKRLKVDVRDARGEFRSFVDILEDLEKAGATTEDVLAIFGKRAGPAMVGVLGQGTAAIRDLYTRIDDTGRTGRIAAIQMQGLNGQIEELSGAAEELAIAFGESGLLGDATALIAKLTSLVRELAKTDKNTLRLVASVGLLVAALGPLLFLFGQVTLAAVGLGKALGFVTAPVRLVGRAFKVLAGIAATVLVPALKLLWGVMRANPLVAVVTIAAALASAAAAIYVNWDRLKTWFHDFWIDLKKWTVDGVREITDSLLSLPGALGDIFFGGGPTLSPQLAAAQASGAPIVPRNVQARRDREAAAAGTKTETKVRIEFDNLPRGAGARVVSGDDSAVDVDLGLSLP